MKPRWSTRARVASALIAVSAGLALIALSPPSPANADQISGNDTSDSPVTVAWSQGLLNADNKTATPRDPSSPLAFMYQDFQNLKVKVSQTENLVHQSIQVTWTGGKPTAGLFQGDFLQIMQCYGDAEGGPTPETCQYGSAGLLAGSSGNNIVNPGIGTRKGAICAKGSTPSVTNPPGTADGSVPNNGCDTKEPNTLSHLQAGDDTDYSVPFVPVGDPAHPVYDDLTEYFNQFNTNEVQEANTGADGSGRQFFQTLTANEAPGLGCGQLEADGSARGCWLVIVPRGEYKPNGWKINPQIASGSPNFLTDSPLGASNWAQRIQIHLSFDPLPPICPIDSATERGTIGTELVAHAVFSWQLALNAQANCKTIYGYATTPEATDTAQLSSDSGAGLAFTTIPIGSEASRGGGSITPPAVIYAPVAASAITFGFNINESDGFVTTPIKLTPRLVAKALTQSYQFDLPEVDSSHPAPKWAAKNPKFITEDPEFTKLNPGIKTPASGSPLAPLLTEDHSGVNQQVWAWILSDPAAKAWLGGAADANGMVVNPDYQALKLGSAPIDSYPRADSTCFSFGLQGSPPKDAVRCSLDLLPYMNNFDDAATHVRAANDPEGASWDQTKIAPDGTAGWWGNGGIEPPGQVFMWAVLDSASLASYGLVPADLCDASGKSCVAPTAASVSAALTAAKPDSAGLLHVNPAKAGGGYPLVNVSYAAVRTKQDAPALTDFANLIGFAAGAGQTAGSLPGQLPFGYLPLPQSLRSQARTAAAALMALAHPSPTTGAPTTPPAAPGVPPGTNAQTPAPPPTGALPPIGSGSPSAGPSVSQTPVPAAALATPRTPVGPARWALIGVMAAGLAGAIGSPLMRVRRIVRFPLPWRQS